MKLIRFGRPGSEKPGLLLADNTRVDVSTFVTDYDRAFFENDGLAKLRAWLDEDRSKLKTVSSSERLGAPVSNPSKIICIGLNYRDHAAETKAKLPTEPVLFFKSTTSLVGANDKVIIPKNAHKLDWEVEMAVVIGKRALYVSKEDALNYVAGFALHNDYSERGFQLERGGQWVKGKSADTFAPLGPFLATKDEISNPQALEMWLKVNGEYRQKSSTSNMEFDVATLVSYITEFMTLLPGDVISTGTPAGVGMGMNPPQFLKAGDVVELGIEGLGQARQEIVNYLPI